MKEKVENSGPVIGNLMKAILRFHKDERGIFGTVKLKDGKNYLMDDYRYVGDGQAIEFIQSYEHDVISIPTEQVKEINVHPSGFRSDEQSFRKGSAKS